MGQGSFLENRPGAADLDASNCASRRRGWTWNSACRWWGYHKVLSELGQLREVEVVTMSAAEEA